MGFRRESVAARVRWIRVFAALLAASIACGTGIALAAQDDVGTPQAPTQFSSAPGAPNGPELESKRTATSETFRLSDGSFETRIYETPINYQDDEGNWQPIDEGLKPTSAEGALTNGDNGFDVTLPARMGDGVVRLDTGEEWVAYELLGPSTEVVQVVGETATYETAEPGVSFDFSSLPNGLKEDIEIADLSQPSIFAFELTASAGLEPSLTQDGSVEFRDSAGEEVAVLPAPTMIDSAGSAALSGEIQYRLEPEGGGWRLMLEADREWLSAPERSWPVTIDPTVTMPSPALDCAFGTYGTAPSTWGACGSGGYQRMYATYIAPGAEPEERKRSALRFDVSSIPSTAYIANATLGLYASSSSYNTSGVELRRATKSWTNKVSWFKYDGTAAWTKAGGDFTENDTILTAERGSQAGWWNFSSPDGMRYWVEGWVNKSISNQGIILKLRDDEPKDCVPPACLKRQLMFNSSAVAETTTRPYLSVTYYPQAPDGSKMTLPKEGRHTAKHFTLQAESPNTGLTGVTFQMKLPGWTSFQNIPTELVTNSQGQKAAWPIPLGGTGRTAPVYFDISAHPSFDDLSGDHDDDKIKIRALFDGISGAGYSAPVNVLYDPRNGGPLDATTAIGPGSVNLINGSFALTRTDVSIPGFGSALEFSRSHSSRDAFTPGKLGVLGSGWKPSVPVEAAGGAAWSGVFDASAAEEEPYAVLTDLEGYEYAFELSEDGSYVSPPEASGWLLSRQDSVTLALTDPGGNRTIFKKGASGFDYLPSSVSQPGGADNKTRMVYEIVPSGPTAGQRRLSMIIAPSAPGVTCVEATATATIGCRSLTFSYESLPIGGGSSAPRLISISYHGPSNATTQGHWEVSRYGYDPEGRLIAQWDPRISPALEELYGYDGSLLTSMTPPGEAPWTFSYADAPLASTRLKSVSRPSLLSSPSTAQTTIAYNVPLSGAGALYEMGAAETLKWAQSDFPLTATAIFPPDQVPSTPPTSYARATIYYMDADGQIVNTATPSGAGTSAPSITTSETNEFGNVTRELTAQNRLRALAAGAGSSARALELTTEKTYGAYDGTELTLEAGPTHEVRLESGEVAQARMHREIEYDKGAPAPPAGTPYPHLPTKETVSAYVAGKGKVDKRITETKYNWTLRKPTDTIISFGTDALDLRTHIEYDATSGLPIERRLPANPLGGDAHSTKFLYYTAGSHPSVSSCGSKPAWANLPCRTMPAAQPGTAGQPELLVTRFIAYNALGQPTEIRESPGGIDSGARTTTITYDAAGRTQTSRQENGGASIPKVQTVYDPDTGRPTIQRFCPTDACTGPQSRPVTTTYDALGRPTEYEDADANLSSTSYDLLGRPVTTSDGKGIQTRTYDLTSGLLVKLEDSGAGTFTASYDADGSLREQGLPNGLVATTTYDETGSPVHLSYEKKTFCSLNCIWLDFDVEESIHGQWITQTSNLSSQQYSYDNAGRLTQVKDTPAGGGCTTRSYSFDANSNRTKLTTRVPGIGGVCDTTSAGTTKNYSYDKGDRLLGTGTVYDGFGRITSLPSAYSGGGTLTSTYYSNNLIKSQAQDGVTNTYELDAALRQRLRTQTGGSNPGTEVYHYAGASDSPAWTDRGSSWERSVPGIGGLGAIQDSSKGTTLQLTNLHGDVVATASISPEAPKLLATFEFDEYGNPKQPGGPKYGWLGGKTRRTELPSGMIQMGVRSYVPAMGRFLSPDPVLGGSANAYEYAGGDPVNNFDLTGEKCVGSQAFIKRCKAKKTIAWMERSNKNRAIIMRFKSKRAAEYFAYSLSRSYIKGLEDKAGKWRQEELAKLYKNARESRIRDSLLPTDPFDCDDLGVATFLAGTALTLARAPQGVALIFGSVTGGSAVIAGKAGVC